MDESVDYTELVEQAQLGNQRCLDSLTELAKERVCAYLYKLTLDYDLAQDLSQETLLEMVESLKNLKAPDRFWVWLFRTALGKTQLYFRDKQRQHAMLISMFEEKYLAQAGSSDYNDGLSKIIRMELSEAMFRAMKRLKFSHRNVLTLRCFEQMSYSEIAQIIDSSELQTHALFFRAKHTLKRQLARDGFDKKWLLVALGTFAKLTAPAKASPAAITASSLKVGLGGTILGAAGTKLGIAIITAVAVASLTVGGITTVNNNIFTALTSQNKDLGKGTFEYPSHLVAASDPDGGGWKGIQVNRHQLSSIVSADPNEWLVGYSSLGKRAVILPAEHWVELEFLDRIIDGPGDDIFLTEFGGQSDRAYVLITDGAGNEYQLGIAEVGFSKQSNFREIGFDISGISLPFVPRAIRVVGINTGIGKVPGFELCNVRARIKSN